MSKVVQGILFCVERISSACKLVIVVPGIHKGFQGIFWIPLPFISLGVKKGCMAYNGTVIINMRFSY